MTNWRSIPSVQYTIDGEIGKARFFGSINLAAYKTFKDTKYKKFGILYSAKELEGKLELSIFCHEIDFICHFEKIMDGNLAKKESDTLFSEMKVKFNKIITKIPKGKFIGASIVFDEQSGKITLGEEPLHMNISTTSGLLFYLSGMLNSDIIGGNADLLIDYYPMLKFISYYLDKNEIKPNRIKINTNDFEEWDFYYPEYDKEIEKNQILFEKELNSKMNNEKLELISIEKPKNEKDFHIELSKILNRLKENVENEGYDFLYNDKLSPETERNCQTYSKVILKEYCKANGIDLTREVNTGRGLVDFRFSNGPNFTAHLEMKKDNNPSLERSLSKQLSTYMSADDVKIGFLIIFDFGVKEISNIIEKLRNEIIEINNSGDKILELIIINTRRKKTASKL